MSPHQKLRDWNVVATIRQNKDTEKARTILQQFGEASLSEFTDVLVLKTDQPPQLLNRLQDLMTREPEKLSFLSRIVPVERLFEYQTPQDFEDRVKEAVQPWLSRIEGKSFHVRMHRRGFKGRLNSQDEERRLAEFIIDSLEKDGKTASIQMDDADIVVDIETVGQRAGVSLWTREELEKYPFLKAA